MTWRACAQQMGNAYAGLCCSAMSPPAACRLAIGLHASAVQVLVPTSLKTCALLSMSSMASRKVHTLVYPPAFARHLDMDSKSMGCAITLREGH